MWVVKNERNRPSFPPLLFVSIIFVRLFQMFFFWWGSFSLDLRRLPWNRGFFSLQNSGTVVITFMLPFMKGWENISRGFNCRDSRGGTLPKELQLIIPERGSTVRNYSATSDLTNLLEFRPELW